MASNTRPPPNPPLSLFFFSPRPLLLLLLLLLFLPVLSVLSAVSGQQRRRNGRQQQPALAYGAPQQAAAAAPQASYGQPEVAQDSASQGQHDHQGLDWLLESVPGTPGTDYPIYGQEALSSFQFDCNSQVEGGEYLLTCVVVFSSFLRVLFEHFFLSFFFSSLREISKVI